MQVGRRFRIYPTHVQQRVLLSWIGCQRFIYNSKVSEDRYFRSFARKSLTHVGEFAPIDQQYSQFKTELTPWLSEVPSQILRNGAYRWKEAYSRFFKGLGGRPTIKAKTGVQSVMLTRELFSFERMVDADSGEITYKLQLGTAKFPVGQITMVSRQDCEPPASIAISVHAGRWHVSFNFDDGNVQPSEADTLAWLQQHSAQELAAKTLGLDRGVAIPLASSAGHGFDLRPIEQIRLDKQERHKKRWQRRQARRSKGSGRWKKAVRRVASCQQYGANVRRNFAHQTSHVITADDRFSLFVFEALKVKNMTASAKGTADAPGNRVRQKAGLNRSILSSAWGQVALYTRYKAQRRGKLVIDVAPHHSSQECAACGYTHPDNRLSQSLFVCQRCRNTENADANASKVIARRGVDLVLAGAAVFKKKKKVGIRKKTVGVECSEPVHQESRPDVPTCVEIMVSPQGASAPWLGSEKRETHTTSHRL